MGSLSWFFKYLVVREHVVAQGKNLPDIVHGVIDDKIDTHVFNEENFKQIENSS